ncbi:hypothetical protein [Streptomyces sp. BV129]|uniref:hypothetical protein n=1 Tax=Streptomyces sp. BV129 TaxID=2849671 RepID=UPI001C2EACB1|nr:hypothetical protein [Streptomyces sp. BV129]MBV1948441.1 hypothetical protein [Streptomyces sp. BV129]
MPPPAPWAPPAVVAVVPVVARPARGSGGAGIAGRTGWSGRAGRALVRAAAAVLETDALHLHLVELLLVGDEQDRLPDQHDGQRRADRHAAP